jgi:hypothetical protein
MLTLSYHENAAKMLGQSIVVSADLAVDPPVVSFAPSYPLITSRRQFERGAIRQPRWQSPANH